jgi:hypothetical protein
LPRCWRRIAETLPAFAKVIGGALRRGLSHFSCRRESPPNSQPGPPRIIPTDYWWSIEPQPLLDRKLATFRLIKIIEMSGYANRAGRGRSASLGFSGSHEADPVGKRTVRDCSPYGWPGLAGSTVCDDHDYPAPDHCWPGYALLMKSSHSARSRNCGRWASEEPWGGAGSHAVDRLLPLGQPPLRVKVGCSHAPAQRAAWLPRR